MRELQRHSRHGLHALFQDQMQRTRLRRGGERVQCGQLPSGLHLKQCGIVCVVRSTRGTRQGLRGVH
jgi:hypothetical protein